jgi:Tfp pilus assembly protein PilX
MSRRHRNAQRGSALLVVMVVLAILTMYAMANTVTLSQLGREIRLIEKEQQEKFRTPSE